MDPSPPLTLIKITTISKEIQEIMPPDVSGI